MDEEDDYLYGADADGTLVSSVVIAIAILICLAVKSPENLEKNDQKEEGDR